MNKLSKFHEYLKMADTMNLYRVYTGTFNRASTVRFGTARLQMLV